MPKQKGVRRLPKIDLSHIYEMMKPIVWRKREGLNNRCGFPPYRGAIFGMVRPRKNSGQICLSLDSKRHPEIYEPVERRTCIWRGLHAFGHIDKSAGYVLANQLANTQN